MYVQSDSSTNKCFDCGLSFNTANELLNHKRRFCINSGYDNLEGLAKIQFNGVNLTHQPKIAHRNYLQHYGTNSLWKMADQQTLKASALQKDMKIINKFRRQQQGANKYKHSSQVDSYQLQNSKSSRLNQTRFTNDDFSESAINEELKKYEKKLTQDQVGPTFIDQFNMRNHTVLDKSNSSLGRMPKKDRMQYAKFKLDELKEIKDMYAQNGGNRQDFKANVDKMIEFYQKFIRQNQKNDEEKEDSLKFIESRVSTPILKLRDLDSSLRKEQSKRSAVKGEEKINNSKIVNQALQPNNIGYQYTQPQVIMVPYSQPQQQQIPSDSMRLLQRMIELKSDQNHKLLEIMLEEKRRNNQPAYASYPNYAQPLNSDLGPNKANNTAKAAKRHIDTEDDYQFKKSMIQDLISEQKVLLSLQQQELDQMKLLSQLPKDLQQIKLKSAIKSSQSRHQIEKQILKQKMERLAYQGSNQAFEEERKLSNDQWAGQERKKLLQNQMSRHVSNFQRELQDDQQN